jgi:pimeloyl-ACP methyl ester carboxylesterase/DNA-binding CsgD family transcriptional regulator
MDPPPAQYVTTSDGYNIAYSIAGEGRCLVFLPRNFSHLRYDLGLHAWFTELASRFRLLRYDGRGQGMSARGLPADYSLIHAYHDLEAVAERIGRGKSVLLGHGANAHVAVRYAVEHQDRVEALILVSCSIAAAAWPSGLFALLPDQDWDVFIQSLAPLRGLGREEARTLALEFKEAVTQQDYHLQVKAFQNSSVDDLLPRLRVPTLVLHPRDYKSLRPDESMKLAARVPNARMALVEGDGILGDADSSLSAIEKFLENLPTIAVSPERIDPSNRPELSGRELEVLRLVTDGKTNKQIADALVISLNTVQRHVSNIFAKTGAANRADAVSYAHRSGLV